MAQSSVDLIVNAVKAINPLRAVAAASKKAEEAINGLKKAAKDTGDKLADMGRRGKKGLSDLAAKAGQAIGKFGKLGKAAALAAAAAGAAAFLKFSFGAAGLLEKQTKSLEVLTGSLDRAKGIISELQAFGAVTPFTSQELIETAKRLKAFGFETEQIVDVTKRLADVSGATGADLSGIATAFGQIQAKGRLQGEELLQLQERGVALGDELREMYGLTGQEFSKALEKGQISADAANVALIRLTEQGGKYANGAVAQSDTLFGRLSTLQDAFQRFGQNIGKVLTPIFRGIIDFLITITNQINNIFKESALENQARKNLGVGTGSNRKFFKEGGRALLDAEKERLRKEGFGETTAPTVPDTKIPELLAGRTAAGGKTPEEIAAENLKKQKATAQSLLLTKKQDALLLTATTEQERESLQLAIEKFNLNRQFPDLSEDELQALRDQLQTNFDLTQQQREKLKLAEALKEQQEIINRLFEQAGQTISTAIVDSLMQAKSVTEALGGALQGIGRQLLQLGVNSLLKLAFPGSSLFSALPGFANGGRPPVGRPSVVGERGPELFVPDRAGTILPNGVGMGSTTITVNVDASETSADASSGQGAQLGKAIGLAVQQELLKQKRPGGLLAAV